ncbi:MAG: UPF0149 family protein [Pseudomonadales bacterium]|nr:UPF0149 family protein [Pseudomonadales bacterium]
MSNAENFSPLDPDELDWLDRVLYERLDEDEPEDAEEGIISVAELDGFFTALVSGPVRPEDVDWLALGWGDFEPEWNNEEEFTTVMNLMQRHLNTIAATLGDAPEEFEPLFMEYEDEGELFLSVDDWCEGYVRAVELDEKRWQAGGEGIRKLLAPIRAFSSATNWRAHNRSSEAEFEQLSASLAPNVRRIYIYWRNAERH